jgi:hypothetical protein
LSDVGVCEIVALSLRLLVWFVDNGFAVSEVLSGLVSLEILCQELDQMSEDDDYVILSVQIANAMQTIDAYLAQESAQNAQEFDQKGPESNQNPGESSAESPPRSFSDDDFTIYRSRSEDSKIPFSMTCRVLTMRDRISKASGINPLLGSHSGWLAISVNEAPESLAIVFIRIMRARLAAYGTGAILSIHQQVASESPWMGEGFGHVLVL